MGQILFPVLTLGGLGLIFGIVLAVASKKFCVVTDPRLEKILSCLPGANCGACGNAGCMAFAEALIKGTETPDSCPVSEEENREEVSKLLGVKSKTKVKKVAVLHCNGGNKVKDKFDYQGIKTCHAANLMFRGQKECGWGCLGFGDCAKACHFQAITMKDSLPVVNIERCTSCGICVNTCPKHLFTLAPINKNVHVRCVSQDLGKATKAVCPVGCIACRLCEKKCPHDAIHVINNCAVIDYVKCTACGECIAVCPQKTILRLE